MSRRLPIYYTPYDSGSDDDSGPESGPNSETNSGSNSETNSVADSETNSDTGYDTSTESTTSSTASFSNAVPNFANFAQELLKPTIDSQVTVEQTGNYSLYNNVSDTILYGISTATLYVPDNSSNAMRSVKQQITSIVNIDSRDRDKQVFNQPTNLQLRLPRVYRNIINFQVVQIKLLSAFYYFRESKNNISISINEQNRFLDSNNSVVTGSNITDSNFNKTLNIITNKIREGSYDINTLINELTIHLNTAPIFYDFVGGFNQFVSLFASTGDYSVGFNLPGDYYYDSIINNYIANPTIDQIVTKYFKSRFANQTSYTVDNIKIAYYYPVLKEVLLDENYLGDAINFSSANSSFLLAGETPYTRCVYYFQGLNDQYILSVIQTNISVLDSYRLTHTFRYTLVNKYVISYDTFNNHISITTPSLNTSLVNLINTKQSNYYAQQFSQNGITSNDYVNLFTQNTLLLAVLTDMYNYLQSNFALQFGVEYNSFTLDYYGNMSNYVYLQNGINGAVSCNYDINVILKNKTPISNSILSYYQTPPLYQWPSLSSNPSSNFSNGANITYFNGNPYNLQADVPEQYHGFIDASKTIYNSRLLNHADTVVNINPSSYVAFKFKSAYRQTLKVETLPRPTKYRYPEYNVTAYDASHVALFDNSYNFIINSSNNRFINSNVTVTPIPGFGTITDSNFGINFSNSYALWSNSFASVSLTQPEDYYSFVPPVPDSSNSPAYRYSMILNISEVTGSNFGSPLNIYIYKDIGTFYADVTDFRDQSPYNYISSNYVSNSTSSLDITITSYQVPTSNQTYYILVRSETTSPTIDYVLTLYFDSTQYTTLSNSLVGFNPNANPQLNLDNFIYSRSYDPNYVHLPSDSNSYQKNPLSNLFADISYNNVPMGYDTNGVSTDLTHYIGYVRDTPNSNALPSTLLYADPITQYIFRAQGGYNSNTQNYFNSNTSNNLYAPQLVSNYNPTTPSIRQYSQVHYYANNYLPNTVNQPPLESKFTTTYSAPFNSNTITNTLSGYTFDVTGVLQLNNGIYGLSLIPGQGTWDIQKYMFKSVISQSNWTQTNENSYSNDPNLNIKYLGVFYTSVVKNKSLSNIELVDSIATLTFSGSRTYNSSNTDYGFGSEGGTYYEFVRDNSFRTGYYSYLYGFTENSNTITNDYNNGYTILGFDSNYQPIPFVGVTGSIVPYPYYSDAVASNAYLDGTTAPTGASLIVPRIKTVPDSSRGPPLNYNQTQAQYEQSMPIGTVYQAYSSNRPIIQSQMFAYSNLNTPMNKIIMDISGYMLSYANELRLYSYDMASSNREFRFMNSFSLDSIFDNDVNITFGAMAANEFEYAFLGLSNDGQSENLSNATLIIKTMNPISQAITTKQIVEISNTFIKTINRSVTSFTFNNYGGFTLAIHDLSSNVNVFYSAAKSFSNLFYNFLAFDEPPLNVYDNDVVKTFGVSVFALLSGGLQGEDPSYSYYTTYQNPNDSTGAFYVSIYKTGIGYNSIYYIQPSITTPVIDISQFSKNIIAVTTISNTNLDDPGLGAKITAYQFTTEFTQLAITRSPIQEIVYGFKATTPQQFYQLSSLTPTSLPYDYIQSYVTSSSNLPIPVYEMGAGFAGGLWFSDLSGQIYGNRFNSNDGIVNSLQYAWQIFYPTQRVIYNSISREVNLMSDLSGLDYPELFHTQLFFYKDLNSFITDLSQNSICSWGNESNFYISDTQYSGYYFNAYSSLIPLSNSTDESVLVVRNYSPTEKSQVYMRFSLPNRYDYGYASFNDISNETLLLSTISSNFNPNYSSNLKSFNSNFIFSTKVFGSNIVPGFYGVTLSNITGFGDFMRYFTVYYNNYQSNIQLINTIQSNVNTNLSNFILTDLQYIIPTTATNRQNFTDPILFSILWKSSLPPQYANLEDNWGLGWNLGYEKQDTPYNLIQTATSFYKILDDYIVLRLNNEFDINRVDTSGKEKLSATLETTGSTKAYYGKLLLAPFGSYAQTMIMNPIAFNPPLGKLDKLTFTWYDNTNTVIDNSDCEWNAVVQIVENIDVVETIMNPPILIPR
jgi:hypothetical protein